MRGELIKKEFENDGAPELGVVGYIYHTDYVLVELFENFVVRYGLPDHFEAIPFNFDRRILASLISFDLKSASFHISKNV